MLLTIDVGNSETKLGIFPNENADAPPRCVWRLGTDRRRTADEISITFAALFARAQLRAAEVEAIVVSSVVPQNDRELAEACRTSFGVEARFFSPAAQRLMPIGTDRPKEVGSDLICAALAARELYGTPAIVIGFGTATTFGAVARDGVFMGAAIAPGIQISIEALVERTAKLPQVALDAPNGPIGRDTISALQSGIVYGFVGQVEGLIARFARELGAEAKVVAYGGLADVVARHTAAIAFVKQNLVLEMLRIYHLRGAE